MPSLACIACMCIHSAHTHNLMEVDLVQFKVMLMNAMERLFLQFCTIV